MDHTWWVVSMPKEFRWCNEPGGQKRWKRRWLRHLGKRCAFPTFPPLRRRRGLSLDLESGHFTCYKNRTSSRAKNTKILSKILSTQKSCQLSKYCQQHFCF